VIITEATVVSPSRALGRAHKLGRWQLFYSVVWTYSEAAPLLLAVWAVTRRLHLGQYVGARDSRLRRSDLHCRALCKFRIRVVDTSPYAALSIEKLGINLLTLATGPTLLSKPCTSLPRVYGLAVLASYCLPVILAVD